MPYATIQDVNTSQNILERVFNIGSVSVFSAYDNNLMELKNISNPSEVEEIIFSRIMGPRSFQPQPEYINQRQGINYIDDGDYLGRNEFYDEFEPITPITHERIQASRREYEYYPENFSVDDGYKSHRYEYEPYDDRFENNVNRIVDDLQQNDAYHEDAYYNNVRDDYSYGGDDYYENIGAQSHYNDVADNFSKNRSDNVDDGPESSEKAIKRHFERFKK